MRDFLAAILALILLFTAARLGTALHVSRKQRQAQRRREQERGRQIVAELPAGADMTLFSEDAAMFSHGDASIDKARIKAVRVLINGTPLAAYESRRFEQSAAGASTSFEDRPEGIAHDRWDVAIETLDGTTLVECGAIRERISQELARRIFDRVKADLSARDEATAPSQAK